MSDEETTPFWRAVVRRAGAHDEYQPGDLAAAYLRIQEERGSTGRDSDDGGDSVSYWDAGTFVVQTDRGELIAASDTVVEVER